MSSPAFAQFSSDLDKGTQAQLNRGQRLVEVLKQAQYQPLPVEKQVVIVFAGTNGFLDSVPVSSLGAYEAELYRFSRRDPLGVADPHQGEETARRPGHG